MRELLAGLLLFIAGGISAQVSTPTLVKQKETAVPIESTSQLTDENAYFRVSRVDLAPAAETRIRHHNHDAVIVVFSDEGLTFTLGKAAKPQELKDGEVRFVKAGEEPSIANPGDKPSQALVIELKQHWESEVHPCDAPKKCTNPILMGEAEIGETASLFSNGFVTAYRHRLDQGGTLTSSYFSRKGKDHLLHVALTDLRASFDGTSESLKRGQAYSSDATDVEVNAEPREARWVVIRVEIPNN